jgi:hypothetical protein
MKVGTDNIASITESSIRWAVILVIMHTVETVKTDIIFIIGNLILYQRRIIFSPLIPKIFVGEIKRKMYKLPIIVEIQFWKRLGCTCGTDKSVKVSGFLFYRIGLSQFICHVYVVSCGHFFSEVKHKEKYVIAKLYLDYYR